MRRRWRGLVTLALMALVVGTILVARPWSWNEIPAASEYSSPSDLARDLNEHGLGCNDTTQPRLYKAFERYLAIFMDRRLIPDTLVCPVDGRPVVLTVYPPASLKVWFGSEPTPTPPYTNFQDAFAHGDDSLIEDLGISAMLVGPNWMVVPREGHNSIPALSAIRGEIGGTLVVASPTPTPSPSA
jgi:hypothetical protein